MTSLVDDTKPVSGNPTTQSVRDNFTIIKSEISALQANKKDKTSADLVSRALYYRDFRDGNTDMSEFGTLSATPVTAVPEKHFGLPLKDMNTNPGHLLTLALNNVTNMKKATIMVAYLINDIDQSWVTSTSTAHSPYFIRLSGWLEYLDNVTGETYCGLYADSLHGSLWTGPGYKPVTVLYTTDANSWFGVEEGRVTYAEHLDLYHLEGQQPKTRYPFNQAFICNRHIEDDTQTYVKKYIAGYSGTGSETAVEAGTEILPGNFLLVLGGLHGTYPSASAYTAYEYSLSPACRVVGVAVFEETLSDADVALIKSEWGF